MAMAMASKLSSVLTTRLSPSFIPIPGPSVPSITAHFAPSKTSLPLSSAQFESSQPFCRTRQGCRIRSYSKFGIPSAFENSRQSVDQPDTDLMLVTELDNTLVDLNDPSHQSLLDFDALWVSEYSRSSTLVYNSGRSPEKYQELRKEAPLLTPDIAILSVGTEIFYGPTLQPDRGWAGYLDEDWDANIIIKEAKKIPALTFQEDTEQRPHKISFKVVKEQALDIIKCLKTKFKEHKLDAKIIYSGGVDLDILPRRAGKGQALAYVLRKAKEGKQVPKEVLVCGDSGNDIDLLTVPNVKGVIVANAQEELLEWHKENQAKGNAFVSSRNSAGGIIEALKHFELGPHISPRKRLKNDVERSEELVTAQDGSATKEIIEFSVLFGMWLTGDVPDTDASFERLTSVIGKNATMIYPWGVERDMSEALEIARSKYGILEDQNYLTWVDCVHEYKLAEGVYYVTWQSWEQLSNERRGYFGTTVIRAKDGNPNGVEVVRVHETMRK